MGSIRLAAAACAALALLLAAGCMATSQSPDAPNHAVGRSGGGMGGGGGGGY